MPVSERIPRLVEGGTNSPAVAAGTLPGLAFRLSIGVPFGRGWQAAEVMAARLESHLSRNVPGLHEGQLGFRRDGLRPTLSPVSAPWSRGSSSVVTWHWPCR